MLYKLYALCEGASESKKVDASKSWTESRAKTRQIQS